MGGKGPERTFERLSFWYPYDLGTFQIGRSGCGGHIAPLESLDPAEERNLTMDLSFSLLRSTAGPM